MKLQISDDLSLPIEAVTEKFAWLGRTGSGKSYGAMKLAEEFSRVKAQYVVLDPVGVWYGLRLSADGKSPGIEIPVLGGLRGDIPLEPSGGALIANLVVDRGTSMILDVSQFESDAAKARFACDFADRFFFRKKSSPSAVHLFIDESQEFVPQNPQREEARMLHAFTRLLKLGRNFGIGASLLSQRPQEVNKKCLNLAEVLFAFQLTGPQERKTVDGWIADKGIDEDIAGELPKLERGHPHVWSPAWLKMSNVIGIAPRWTFDASSTPKVGKAAAVRELSPIDMQNLQKEMATTIEKAKAEDPKLLRARITELEKQLKDRPAGERVVEKEKRVEVPVLKNGQLDKALKLVDRMAAIMEGVREVGGNVANAISKAAPAAKTAPTSTSYKPSPAPMPRPNTSPVQPRPQAQAAVADGHLTPGESKILTACIQFPEGIYRDQLSVLVGYKKSSRDTYVKNLAARGHVENQGGKVIATQAGIAAMPNVEPLPTGEDLRIYWLQRLPAGEKLILEVLIANHPNDIERSALDELTPYKKSSRDTYLKYLMAKQLVVNTGKGRVRASDHLF